MRSDLADLTPAYNDWVLQILYPPFPGWSFRINPNGYSDSSQYAENYNASIHSFISSFTFCPSLQLLLLNAFPKVNNILETSNEKVFGLHIIKVRAYIIYHHTPLLCRGVLHTPEGISGAATCRGKVRLPSLVF